MLFLTSCHPKLTAFHPACSNPRRGEKREGKGAANWGGHQGGDALADEQSADVIALVRSEFLVCCLMLRRIKNNLLPPMTG